MSEEYVDIDGELVSNNKSRRGLWALIILLILLVAFLLNDRSKHLNKESQWRSLALTENNQAKIWRNKAGLSQAESQAQVVNLQIYKEAFEKDKAGLLNQVAGLKKNLSNLQSVTNIQLQTSGNLGTTIRDSIIYKQDSTTTTLRTSSYNDHWVQLSVIFSEDSANWKYSFYDSLVFVGYQKKDHWYSFRRKLYVNAQAFNPHSSITGFSHQQIAEKRRSRFAIGPYVGIGINGRPQVGLGIFYRLFEF